MKDLKYVYIYCIGRKKGKQVLKQRQCEVLKKDGEYLVVRYYKKGKLPKPYREQWLNLRERAYSETPFSGVDIINKNIN